MFAALGKVLEHCYPSSETPKAMWYKIPTIANYNIRGHLLDCVPS